MIYYGKLFILRLFFGLLKINKTCNLEADGNFKREYAVV